MTFTDMIVLPLLSGMLLVSATAAFGEDFKKGDSVRVQFAGKTHNTKVDRVLPTGWVQVKIKMNGIVMTPALPPNQVKKLSSERPRISTSSKTSSEGSGMRSWKGADGNLITVGKLLKVDDGQAHVRSANGITMMIPLDKLSAEDQRFVDTGPGTSSSPSVQKTAEDDSPFGEVDWAAVPQVRLPVEPGKISVDTVAAQNVTSKSIALKGTESPLERPISLLFNAGRNLAYCNIKNPTPGGDIRLERISLTRGESLGTLDLPQGGSVLDVSPSGSLLLWRSDEFRGGTKNKVVVLQIAGKRTTQLVAWEPYPSDNWAQRDVSFTAFLDEDHVLTAGGRGKFALWNIKTHKVVYQVSKGARGKPALSPGRKQVALITDFGIAVLNSLTGDSLGLLPGDTRTHQEVAFSSNGKSVASLTPKKLMVHHPAVHHDRSELQRLHLQRQR